MNGSNYIDFAAKIAVTYSDAASCRSAISRAYCGAFHVARAFLSQLDSRPPRNANVHAFIQHRLANCGHASITEVGKLLAGLHRDRLYADYNLMKAEVEELEYAKSRVAAARTIESSIEACDTDEIRQQIKAGIDEYERKIGVR